MEEPSMAAQIIVAVIPIVGIFMGALVVFFYLLWRHRQVMLQIRTGGYHPRKFDWVNFSLLAGILLFCLGLGLTILFAVITGCSMALLGGVIPLLLGIGLICFYSIVTHDQKARRTDCKTQ